MSAAVAATTVAVAPLADAEPAAALRAPVRQITYTEFTTQEDLVTGRFRGTRAAGGVIKLGTPTESRVHDDPYDGVAGGTRFDLGHWSSPWTAPGHSFDELIPSWDARTPRSSWIEVSVRGRTAGGQTSRWYTMANWAAADRTIRRTSLRDQRDALGQVNVDTLRATSGFASWQLRVTLLRRSGTTATPAVDTVGAVASRLPSVDRVATSLPGVASGHRLDLPAYSQMAHKGTYPEYNGGGAAWCSPTSVSMVLGYYGRLPSAAQYSWVSSATDPWVVHAARSHYDYGYDGAGNWSFSAAYGANRAGAGFVTRLRSLREAERFIRAGIPLVASVRFRSGQLSGAPISSTNGHLLVISGFTDSGDVVVHDPAASRREGVVRVYDRGQFENVWVPTSGGLVYVVRTDDRPLPKGRTTNW